MSGSTRGLPNFLHPLALAALGVALSVGMAYGVLGSDIRANTAAVSEIRKTLEVIHQMRIDQAKASEQRKSQGKDITRILTILEKRYGIGRFMKPKAGSFDARS